MPLLFYFLAVGVQRVRDILTFLSKLATEFWTTTDHKNKDGYLLGIRLCFAVWTLARTHAARGLNIYNPSKPPLDRGGLSLRSDDRSEKGWSFFVFMRYGGESAKKSLHSECPKAP